MFSSKHLSWQGRGGSHTGCHLPRRILCKPEKAPLSLDKSRINVKQAGAHPQVVQYTCCTTSQGSLEAVWGGLKGIMVLEWRKCSYILPGLYILSNYLLKLYIISLYMSIYAAISAPKSKGIMIFSWSGGLITTCFMFCFSRQSNPFLSKWPTYNQFLSKL